MPDLFPETTPEELQKRKIEQVGILLNKAHEELAYAATLAPGRVSLVKIEEIKIDLLEITNRIENLNIN